MCESEFFGEGDGVGEQDLPGAVACEFSRQLGVDATVPGQVGGVGEESDEGRDVDGDHRQRPSPIRRYRSSSGAVGALTQALQARFAVHPGHERIAQSFLSATWIFRADGVGHLGEQLPRGGGLGGGELGPDAGELTGGTVGDGAESFRELP